MGCLTGTLLDIIARVCAGLGAGYLGTVGVMRFFEKRSEAQFYILAVYFVIFAVMIVLAIIPVPFVTKFFTFLKGHIGLGLFLAFCAFLMFDWTRTIEFGNSIFLLVAAALNIFVGCCPSAA